MEFTDGGFTEVNAEWNEITDFILLRVDDPDCQEVQERINKMSELFFECFNY